MWPPPLLRTAVRMLSGTMARLLASNSSTVCGEVGRRFQRLIQIGDISVVVLAMVNSMVICRCTARSDRRVRQCWKRKCIVYLSLLVRISPRLACPAPTGDVYVAGACPARPVQFTPPALSNASAMRNMVISPKCRVRICIPTGRPSAVRPHGTLMHGMPAGCR